MVITSICIICILVTSPFKQKLYQKEEPEGQSTKKFVPTDAVSSGISKVVAPNLVAVMAVTCLRYNIGFYFLKVW